MLSEGLDAAEASFRVGYESPSQFSREYRRLFGVLPRQDVAAMKGRSRTLDRGCCAVRQRTWREVSSLSDRPARGRGVKCYTYCYTLSGHLDRLPSPSPQVASQEQVAER
ncbi:AraC family transcriptional regulator [Zavarzinella formosa]|uniref:AraC family transcriptional regulator n=1 Tax=Zavarzinella formosa TaxID=360055 RepID=UPI000907B77E